MAIRIALKCKAYKIFLTLSKNSGKISSHREVAFPGQVDHRRTWRANLTDVNLSGLHWPRSGIIPGKFAPGFTEQNTHCYRSIRSQAVLPLMWKWSKSKSPERPSYSSELMPVPSRPLHGAVPSLRGVGSQALEQKYFSFLILTRKIFTTIFTE